MCVIQIEILQIYWCLPGSTMVIDVMLSDPREKHRIFLGDPPEFGVRGWMRREPWPGATTGGLGKPQEGEVGGTLTIRCVPP